MVNNVKLSTPWVSFYNELNALFWDDPNVSVEYVAGDGEDPEAKLYVLGADKAEAIAKLLPKEKVFGNVRMKVTVVPANEGDESVADTFRKAFDGNPALSYVASVKGIMSNDVHYIVFRNKVVQYWNDDLGDINGNETTLYEDIAKDVFKPEIGAIFCTDIEGNPGKPVCPQL